MWDILHVYNMKEFLETLVKWFRCKFCCQSECSVGEDNKEETIRYDYYSQKRKNFSSKSI